MRLSTLTAVILSLVSLPSLAQVPPPPGLSLGEGEFVGWEVDLELFSTIDCPQRPPELNGPQGQRFEAPLVRTDVAPLEGAEYVGTRFQYFHDFSFESAWLGVPGIDVPGSNSQLNFSPISFDLGPFENFPDSFSGESLLISCPPGECPPFEFGFPGSANQPWLDFPSLPLPPLPPADPEIGTGSIEWGCEFTGSVLLPEFARQTQNFVFRWRGIYRKNDTGLRINQLTVSPSQATVVKTQDALINDRQTVALIVQNDSTADIAVGSDQIGIVIDSPTVSTITYRNEDGVVSPDWDTKYTVTITECSDFGVTDNITNPSALYVSGGQIIEAGSARVFTCTFTVTWDWLRQFSVETFARISSGIIGPAGGPIDIVSGGPDFLYTRAPEAISSVSVRVPDGITLDQGEGRSFARISRVVSDDKRDMFVKFGLSSIKAFESCSSEFGQFVGPGNILSCAKDIDAAVVEYIDAYDPPPTYQEIALPKKIELVRGRSLESLLENVSRLRVSIRDAASHAFQRLQSAKLAGDDNWYSIQASAYIYFGRVVLAIDKKKAEIESRLALQDTSSEPDIELIIALLPALATQGFDEATRLELLDRFSLDEIVELEQIFSAIDPDLLRAIDALPDGALDQALIRQQREILENSFELVAFGGEAKVRSVRRVGKSGLVFANVEFSQAFDFSALMAAEVTLNENSSPIRQRLRQTDDGRTIMRLTFKRVAFDEAEGSEGFRLRVQYDGIPVQVFGVDWNIIRRLIE